MNLTTQNDLLLNKLMIFYNKDNNLDKMLNKQNLSYQVNLDKIQMLKKIKNPIWNKFNYQYLKK